MGKDHVLQEPRSLRAETRLMAPTCWAMSEDRSHPSLCVLNPDMRCPPPSPNVPPCLGLWVGELSPGGMHYWFPGQFSCL